jgi:membrane protein
MASNRFSRLIKILTGTSSGADEELLQLEGKLERTTHFWTLVVRHFVRNRCLIRASALAYTSLLAMIPLLAVVISISTSLLKNVDQDKFYQAIASLAPASTTAYPAGNSATNANAHATANIDTNAAAPEAVPEDETAATNAVAVASAAPPAPHDTVQKDVAVWLKTFVDQTQGASLGVTGMVIFVLIAIMMLSRIEETFNDIWGVSRGRGWLTRVVLYWTAITLGPILLLTAISLAGGSQVQTVKDYFQAMPILANLLFKLLPLVVLWLAFGLIYQIVPNTKVQFSAALAGGFVAGTLWHLNNVFGFIYVSKVIQSSGMYGAVGLVPVFMLGLYFSWAILLFGAQVAYAFQNRAAYLQDKLADNVNQRGREFVALRIMTLVGQRFQNGLKPAGVIQLANELGVPSRLTQQILRTLAGAHLVTEVGGGDAAYVPARPLDTINAHHILLALRSGSGRELPVAEAPALAEIYGEFARIEDAERTAAEKISLLALTARAPARPAIETPPPSHVDQRITDALIVEEISKTSHPETAAPQPPESAVPETPPATPPPTEAPAEKTSARRETVKPEEHDFPL